MLGTTTIQLGSSLAARVALFQNGFVPTPLHGKVPVLKEWQKKTSTNRDEIALWGRLYPTATNTGALTQKAPTIDIDITIEPAAVAIEELAREEFEERGTFLTRIGKPPKRAVLLRTDEPFDKLKAEYTAPDGSHHKIEVLADGQQVVMHGVHPDTGRPYVWPCASPMTTPRDDLPYVRRDDAVAFLDKASALLDREFGFQLVGKAKSNGHDTDGRHDPADWDELVGNIVAGRDLHDSTVRLAASCVARGDDERKTAQLITTLYHASTAPKDGRWKERFDDIGRVVRSACEKFGKKEMSPATHDVWEWRFFGRQEESTERAYLVDKLLPETGVGLIAGQWGTYKTFTALDLAAAVITGTPFAGFNVARQGAVLFVAMESEGEVDIRCKAALAHRGYTDSLAPFAWINACPRLLDPNAGQQLAEMVKQAAERIRQEFNSPVVLVIVDTAGKAAGYTKAGDENDSTLARQVVGALAEASRETGALFLGVDHFGKAAETGTRGSSAKEGDCDAVLALLGDKNISGEVTNPRLAVRKRKSGPNGVEIPFRPKIVQAGEDETTLVIDWLQADQVAPAAKVDR